MGLKEIRPGTVAILMPCGGDVDPRVVQSIINVANGAWQNGIQVRSMGVTNRTVVQTARNYLAKQFLETDMEWAFWADADMVFEPRTLPVMLKYADKLNAKMLTGVYYGRLGRHTPILYRKRLISKDGKVVKENDDRYLSYIIYPEHGHPPIKADIAGFGCSLIHRDVIDKMSYPYFKFESYVEGGKEKEASEDFYFYTRARELGFQLWAIPELECGHISQGEVITYRNLAPALKEQVVLDAEKL